MLTQIGSAGTRRLLIAAGLSVALHAAIVLSLPRVPDGGAPPAENAAPPLIARLATAVTDAMLPAAVPPVTVTPETAVTPAPKPLVSPATTANDAPSGSESAHYYFKTAELDRRPFPLTRIDVPPPESATTETGSVMIRLRISERGRVEDAKIVMGTGIAEFEAAALREFSRTQFHPGYRGNLPVRSEMLIEVTLRPPADVGKNRDRAEPAMPKS